MNNNFPWSIREGREVRLHGGFRGGRKPATMAQTATYRFNFRPVLEYLPKIFKILGLVSLRDVDRLGASDADVVGMQDVRNGREALLFDPLREVADEFELLFNHWNEAGERVEWSPVWI